MTASKVAVSLSLVEGTDMLTMGGTRLMSLGDLLNIAFLSVNNPTFYEIRFMDFFLNKHFTPILTH